MAKDTILSWKARAKDEACGVRVGVRKGQGQI